MSSNNDVTRVEIIRCHHQLHTQQVIKGSQKRILKKYRIWETGGLWGKYGEIHQIRWPNNLWFTINHSAVHSVCRLHRLGRTPSMKDLGPPSRQGNIKDSRNVDWIKNGPYFCCQGTSYPSGQTIWPITIVYPHTGYSSLCVVIIEAWLWITFIN